MPWECEELSIGSTACGLVLTCRNYVNGDWQGPADHMCLDFYVEDSHVGSVRKLVKDFKQGNSLIKFDAQQPVRIMFQNFRNAAGGQGINLTRGHNNG